MNSCTMHISSARERTTLTCVREYSRHSTLGYLRGTGHLPSIVPRCLIHVSPFPFLICRRHCLRHCPQGHSTTVEVHSDIHGYCKSLSLDLKSSALSCLRTSIVSFSSTPTPLLARETHAPISIRTGLQGACCLEFMVQNMFLEGEASAAVRSYWCRFEESA